MKQQKFEHNLIEYILAQEESDNFIEIKNFMDEMPGGFLIY